MRTVCPKWVWCAAFGAAVWSAASALTGWPSQACAVAGLVALVAALWVTEAVPLGVAALLPLALLPMTGALGAREVCAAYANEAVFLFLGGFLLSAGMQESGLHRRLGGAVAAMAGSRPDRQVAAMLVAAGWLSMGMSNTAAALMLLPVAKGVIDRYGAGPGARDFQIAILLAVAWGASIGGVATPIGTPPNALLLAFLHTQSLPPVSYLEWVVIGIPLSLAMAVTAWLLLTRVMLRVPGSPGMIPAEVSVRRPWTTAEVGMASIFTCAIAAWMLRGSPWGGHIPFLERLGDAGVSIVAGVSVFLLRRDGAPLLAWPRASSLVSWEVLLLFGGGLALSAGMVASGLSASLAASLDAVGAPVGVRVAAVACAAVFASSFVSNTALAGMLFPIVPTLFADAPHAVPAALFATAWGASLSFMMPAATPPNAIVLAGGGITARDMFRIGLPLNFAAVAWVTLFAFLADRFLF